MNIREGMKVMVIHHMSNKGIVTKVFREKDLASSKWSEKKLKKDEINARHKHVRKTKDLYEDGKFVLGGSGEKDTIIFIN